MKLFEEERFVLNENQTLPETILFYNGHLLALARRNFNLDTNIQEGLGYWIIYKNQQFRTDAKDLDFYSLKTSGSFSVRGNELFAVYNNTIYSINLQGLNTNGSQKLKWQKRANLRHYRKLQKSFWIDNQLIVVGGDQ